MSTTHTPTPWRIEGQESNNGTINRTIIGDKPIASILRFNPYEVTDEQQMEDARRIVACVNACEGIPTEVLIDKEARRLEPFFEAIELDNQRDKLLNLLAKKENEIFDLKKEIKHLKGEK